MELSAETIFEQALKLPENERLMLVSRLLETMLTQESSTALDDPALVEELDRRFTDREGSVAWSDLRAEP